MDKDEVLKWLERKGTRKYVVGMARYSIQTKKARVWCLDGNMHSLAKRLDFETVRIGFASACKKEEITCGQTKAGGITWHDLRHRFATRLRGERVHELDIMQLLGHSSLGVTAGYAHGTPTVIQNAVDKLAKPRGEVVEFARRAV